MPSRRERPDRIDHPGPLLGKLRTMREELIRASAGVKPFGTTYHGLSMVIAAIDSLAVLLSGERDYFMGQGTTASEGQRQAEEEKRRREI